MSDLEIVTMLAVFGWIVALAGWWRSEMWRRHAELRIEIAWKLIALVDELSKTVRKHT